MFYSFLSLTQTHQFYQILWASLKPGKISPNATTKHNFFVVYKIPKGRNNSQLLPIYYRRCFSCCDNPSGPRSPFCWGLEITIRHATLGRPPLDEWSSHRRDACLTKHNYHERQTSMSLVEFEPTFSPSQRPQNHALVRAATGGDWHSGLYKLINICDLQTSSEQKKKQLQFTLNLQRELQNILIIECNFYVYKNVAITTHTKQKR